MKIYKVNATILGHNDMPENSSERIFAVGWEEALGVLSGICRDTGCVITDLKIVETDEVPFARKSQTQ